MRQQRLPAIVAGGRHTTLPDLTMQDSRPRLRLKDITPAEASCAPLPMCPGVFKSNRNTYVIVGKTLSTADALELAEGRVARDEAAVEVPAHIIDLLPNGTE